jgi:hypothetical protein
MLMLDEYEPLVRLKVFMRWDQPDGVYGRFRTR